MMNERNGFATLFFTLDSRVLCPKRFQFSCHVQPRLVIQACHGQVSNFPENLVHVRLVGSKKQFDFPEVKPQFLTQILGQLEIIIKTRS